MKKIQVVHPYITEAETAVALSHCNNEEEEAVVWLTDPVNLQTIRKEVALSAMEKDGISINSNEEIDENDEDKKFIKRKRKQKGARNFVWMKHWLKEVKKDGVKQESKHTN